MTSRRQRRAAKRRSDLQDAGESVVEDQRFRPKTGPGQVFARELIDMKSGHAKRFRNIANTPLMLAYWRGQLCSLQGSTSRIDADQRFQAGEFFEKLWYELHRSGHDSTDYWVGGGDHLPLSEHRQETARRLADIAARMYRLNFVIVRRFCGEGCSMIESLRAVELSFNPRAVATRICESLDDLVYATGRAMPVGQGASNPITTARNEIPTHPFHDIA